MGPVHGRIACAVCDPIAGCPRESPFFLIAEAGLVGIMTETTWILFHYGELSGMRKNLALLRIVRA